MKSNIIKGKLIRWNEERGFGFISSNSINKDIFIHISSLKKMNRRPMVGDIIYFKEHIRSNGKRVAINATIEGASLRKNNIQQKKKTQWNKKNIASIIYFFLFIIIGYFAYNRSSIITHQPTMNSVLSMNVPSLITKKNYSCQGKIYCSEMTSCGEAKFYQNNCPGTKMDGDRDGIPCESQWCSW